MAQIANDFLLRSILLLACSIHNARNRFASEYGGTRCMRDTGHLAGAILIPVQELEQRINELTSCHSISLVQIQPVRS